VEYWENRLRTERGLLTVTLNSMGNIGSAAGAGEEEERPNGTVSSD
jgi:hypothetical protein